MLPIVPPPLLDERLSSWLVRMAEIYRASPGDLCAHIGMRAQHLHHLDLEPGEADIARLSLATGASVEALLQMTFCDTSTRIRGLVDIDSKEVCLACADEAGTGRALRLREWAFVFTLRCQKHGRRLHGSDMSGLDSLGDEQLARRGANILRQWAMDEAATTPPMAAAVRLLLTPYRAPSPPAPWELARISSTALRKRHRELVRPWPRKALSRIVPEYDRTVAIYDQRLPEKMSGLHATRAVERHAVAIGIARMIADPVGAAVEILLGCDDFGRSRIEAWLSARPISVREAIVRANGRRLRSSRRGRAGSAVAPGLERRRSGIDETTSHSPCSCPVRVPALNSLVDQHLKAGEQADMALPVSQFRLGSRPRARESHDFRSADKNASDTGHLRRLSDNDR